MERHYYIFRTFNEVCYFMMK